MQPSTIKISDVKITSRMRKDLGDVSALADSIRERGLIQPIVLAQDNTLLAGERRLRAHQHLGLDEIKFVYFTAATEDIKAEVEFEENFWRKSFTWQEECLGILDIWRKKRRQGALEGWTWGQREAGEMFGMQVGTMNYVLAVAKRLDEELKLPEDKRKFHKFSSCNEAYRMGILGEREDVLLAEQAKAAQVMTLDGEPPKPYIVDELTLPPTAEVIQKRAVEMAAGRTLDQILLDEARERYNSNPLNVMPFDEYWAEREASRRESENSVYLSNRLFNEDCITFMNEREGCFNHIIADPPYGIDMDMLNQQNTHGGMADLDKVINEHDVDENTALLAKFFPAAYRCTKDNAFVVVCGDAMQWQHMYNHAIAAGFAVQRWPYIWRKVNQSVMNNCAGFNTTKDYEIVMICRKKGATLAAKRNTSFTDAGNNEVTKLTGHPFAKPFELTRDLVDLVSTEGQSILDPFAGRGSLVLQFLKMKRNGFGVEKQLEHYNALVENIKTHHYLKLNPKSKFK